MRVCSGAGCLRAVQDYARFCDECSPAAATDDIRKHTLADRERYRLLYSGKRWARVRVRAIKRQPICARCDQRISEIVDHVIPAGVVIQQAQQSERFKFDRFAGFYIESNLQGLCRPCHGLKTNEDKAHTGAWDNAIEKHFASKRKTYAF